MKNIQFLLFGAALTLLLFACENNSSTEKKQAPRDPAEAHNIAATIKKLGTIIPLADVAVVIENGGVSTPYDTTKSNGKCTLPNITIHDKYHFEKEDYTPLEITFEDFVNLSAINIYLREGTITAIQTNLTGTVYNQAGQRIENAKIRSGNDSTYSKKNGLYSFDVPAGANYPINYIQGPFGAQINVEAEQDTVEVDVFIDGFTTDTIQTKTSN